MVGVLFVCTGNICRSPTAEGVFRDLVDRAGLSAEIRVDSAGTHGYHIGDAPDSRSAKAALKRGIDLSGLRARKSRSSDFHDFDFVLAMDDDNMRFLDAQKPVDATGRLALFLEFGPPAATREVPDPYYGSGDGFETVLDMTEAAAAGLLAHIRAHHNIGS